MNIIKYAWEQIDDLHKVGAGFGLGAFSVLLVLLAIPDKKNK